MDEIGFRNRARELDRLESERPDEITAGHLTRMEAALRADRREARAARRQRTTEIVDQDGFAPVGDVPEVIRKLRRGSMVKVRGKRDAQLVVRRSGGTLTIRPLDSQSSTTPACAALSDVTHVRLSSR